MLLKRRCLCFGLIATSRISRRSRHIAKGRLHVLVGFVLHGCFESDDDSKPKDDVADDGNQQGGQDDAENDGQSDDGGAVAVGFSLGVESTEDRTVVRDNVADVEGQHVGRDLEDLEHEGPVELGVEVVKAFCEDGTKALVVDILEAAAEGVVHVVGIVGDQFRVYKAINNRLLEEDIVTRYCEMSTAKRSFKTSLS